MTAATDFPASKTAIPLSFGAMTVGGEGTMQARIHDLPTFQSILDLLKEHGQEEIDTARVYGSMTSEEYVRDVGAERQGFKIATKCFPNSSFGAMPDITQYDHTPKMLRQSVNDSMKALSTDKVDLFYLHAPDRKNPIGDALRVVDEEYKKGRFDRFGISNYTVAEIEEIMRICEANGYVKPTVYQGLYNCLVRSAEAELVPCLRKYGISYYIYNPLGGGFLTGTYKPDKRDEEDNNAEKGKGSRFDKSSWQGQSYRKRYFHDAIFEAIEVIRPKAEAHQIPLAEVALRWCMHHSVLKKEYNDHVIFSASSIKHVQENLTAFEKGPLPDALVKAIDEAWTVVNKSGQAPKYHF